MPDRRIDEIDNRTPDGSEYVLLEDASTATNYKATLNNSVTANSEVAANTLARHTHANKAVLDATSASYLSADKTKLDGVAVGATANDTDANLKNRANHTGTQAIATISGLQTVLDSTIQLGGDITGTAASPTVKSRIITRTVAPTGTVADVNTTGTSDQTIINAALLVGPTRLRKGSYTISAPISMPTNGYLEAEDGVTITLANASNTIMVTNADTTNGNSNITIKNISFDGNKTNQTSTTVDVLYFNKVTTANIENVSITNSSQMGMNISTSSFIRITGGKVNASATRNIYLTATTDSRIERVESSYAGTTGIEMQNGSHRNEIIRNYVHHAGAYSIMGGSSAGTQNEYCRFIQNRIIYGGDDALVIDHNNYALVDGNYVGYSGSHAGDQGLPIDTSLHVICTNNTVEFNRADGIEVKNSSNFCIIAHNKTRNNSNPIVGGASDGCGIVVRGGITYCTIIGNVSFCDEATPSQRRGIMLTDTGNDYNVVTGNTVYGNSINQIAEAGGISTTSHNKIFANPGAEAAKMVDEPYAISNSTTSNAVMITQTGNVGASRTKGALYIDNTGNLGNGFSAYTPGALTGYVGALFNLRAGDLTSNTTFDFNPALALLTNVTTQSGMMIDQNNNLGVSRAALVVESNVDQTTANSYGLLAVRQTTSGSTQRAVWIDNQGSGEAVKINSTNGRPLLITQSGNTLGIDHTNSRTNANGSSGAVSVSSNTTVNDGNTYTKSGTALAVASNVTQTSGTITDTSKVATLAQNNSAATGTVFTITNAGTGLSADIAGKAKVGSLQVGSSATAGYVLTADASGNATFQASTGSGANTEWLATDNGLLSWSYDSTAAINGTILPTAGQMQCVRLKVLAGTVTNIILDVFTAGATLTSGQCFAALYQGGTLLGQTADQSTAWTTTNAKTMALATPATVTAGYVYVTFWANGTTLPQFSRNVNRSNVNTALTSTTYRFASSGTGITTTAPGTLGTLTASSTSWWAGLS